MVRRMLMLAVVLALAATVGCSRSANGYPHYTTMKWMAGGAAVGAGTGAIIGAHAAEAGEGALIGGLAGATLGGLVGNIIEEKDIKAEMDRLLAEIDRLNSENAALKNELAAKNARIAELEAELAKLRGQRGVEIELTLGADVLFRPGSAVLSAAGKKALDDAAEKIKSEYSGKFVMVEGHTDSDPIKVSGWKSNWELGAARSLTVLHYLNDKGVDAAMMSAATFSKYQPVAGNDNTEGKAKNRRAVIVIYKNWNKPEVK